MPTRLQLREMGEKRQKIAHEAGEILKRAAQQKRPMTRAETHDWELRHADVEALDAKMDAGFNEIQQALEQKGSEPRPDNRTAGREDIDWRATGATTRQKQEERDIFRIWISEGPAGLSAEQREIVTQRNNANMTYRALSAVTGASGAYSIPQGFQYTLDIVLKYYGGILQAADYIPTEMGNLLPYPTFDDTANSGEIIGENTQVAGTSGGAAAQDPTFGVVNFSAYMFDSGFLKIPIQLFQDSAFDLEQIFNEQLGIRIGRRMNNKFTVGAGSGSSEPKGVVNAAALGKTGASPTTISYNELLDMEHSVDPAYRRYDNPKCGFMFSDNTLKSIKKLTDSNSRPLWIAGGVSEGVQGRRPDTFNGWPFFVNQDMSDLGSSAKSLLFGDFSKYKVRRVQQMVLIKAQERFIDALEIGLLAYQRADGNLINTAAVKFFINSAT